LRACNIIPVSDFMIDFAKRFGFDYRSGFNMSEVSCPIGSAMNPTVPGSCGRVRTGVQVRLVDANDIEVPVGEIGELICRTDHPWAMSHGYNKMPEATARAWRNGWFHTGDAFRQDEDGNFYFVDRMKDTIRRRGENVSSMEVEAEVLAHPAVLDVAALPVPADESEDEILVVVTPKPGQVIDPAELIRFLIPRMTHFMVPRYIRVMAELPKTETNKVQKHLLRTAGVTPDTFDRVRAGIVVSRA
jgi:crotonobetaine/carnitine-CoA ligase